MANELGSNTTENSGKRGKPFTKGDPRINRKGRPKSFDALRELAQEIAHEKAKNSDGKVIVHDGHAVTVAEAIMRKWASSNNPQLQKAFVEIAFGKPPENVTGHGEFEKAEVILYLPKKEDHEDGHQTATETGIIP